MSILVDQGTRVCIQGITGRQAGVHVPLMGDYGTNIVAGVSPGRGGSSLDGIPIFSTVARAVQDAGPIDLSVLFVPARAVLDAALEAIDAGIPTLVVLAEGVPTRDAVEMLAAARARDVTLIGPNSQGIISPGKARVGGTGGFAPERMFRPGRVGVVSRSGGMGAETCWLLTRHGFGQSTYVAIGGEAFVGSGLLEIARRFEHDDSTDLIVCFGEPGTSREQELADGICRGEITKPVVAYIPGNYVEEYGRGQPFGHAGAIADDGDGSPTAKRAALREAGGLVAERWRELPDLVADALPASARPSTARTAR